MGLDDDEVAIDLQREPFGRRHRALGRVLQEQLCRGVHALQPRREGADLRVELRQASRLVGLVAHLAAQRLGDGAQGLQETAGVVGGLAKGLHQRLGQCTARHAGTRGHGLGKLPPARHGCAQLLAIEVHDQARQVLQRGAQACGVVGDVGNLLHLDQLAYAQRAAGQLVYPAQARQVGLAGELIQRRGRQVVGLVDDQ